MKTTSDVLIIGSGIKRKRRGVLSREKRCRCHSARRSFGDRRRRIVQERRRCPPVRTRQQRASLCDVGNRKSLADPVRRAGRRYGIYAEGKPETRKTQAHLDKLVQLAQSAGKVGLDVRMTDAMEAREINPYLSEEVAGASWCPTDGHANPLKTTLAFYRAARRLGARFYTNAIVERIEKVHGRARKCLRTEWSSRRTASSLRRDTRAGRSSIPSGSTSRWI